MKKLFLTLMIAVCTFTLSNAAISNLQVEVDSTNADFYWQGDTTLSKVYEIDLLEGSEFGYIAAGAWRSKVFDTGQGGWMWMSTDLLLAYGQNFADIEAAGASASVVEAWKTNWDAAVDTTEAGFTLKPGEYVIVIEGYDASYDQVTESMAYKFFTIEEPEQPVEPEDPEQPEDPTSLSNPNSSKTAVKFIKGNRIIIVRDNTIYDIFGRKVE